MTYTKDQKRKLYIKYKLREKCNKHKEAEILKTLYRCMVLEISDSILIKI